MADSILTIPVLGHYVSSGAQYVKGLAYCAHLLISTGDSLSGLALLAKAPGFSSRSALCAPLSTHQRAARYGPRRSANSTSACPGRRAVARVRRVLPNPFPALKESLHSRRTSSWPPRSACPLRETLILVVPRWGGPPLAGAWRLYNSCRTGCLHGE